MFIVDTYWVETSLLAFISGEIDVEVSRILEGFTYY